MARNADGGITEIRQMVDHLNATLAESGSDIQTAIRDLRDSAHEIRGMVQNAAVVLERTGQDVNAVQRRITLTLDRIERASDSLNRFFQRVAAEPSQIVFSAPPPEKPSAP